MLVATFEKHAATRMIVRMKGGLGAGSAIYIGTLLEEALNNRITNLTLDFSGVLDFDYTGISSLAGVLDFRAQDFSEITCSGLPQNITDLFKVFIVDKTSGLEVLAIDDDPRIVAPNSLC
jgi:ABC-type transporter Mla MlaB component